MQPPTRFIFRVLYFFNVLGDTHPACLDWTKVGVAMSTVFTCVTGAMAATQQVLGTAGHTDWGLFASAIGLHGMSHGVSRLKRHQES